MYHRYNKFFSLLSFLLLIPSLVYAQDFLNISAISQYYHNWQAGVYDIAVQGDYAYLACENDGLRIINIAEPNSFHDVARLDYDYALKVAVSGNYAYLATISNDIHIIDISNPASPQEVGLIPLDCYIEMFRLTGNYLFANTLGGGLAIYDISNPLNPLVVSSPNNIPELSDIEIHGETAYGAGYLDGLMVIDISDFTSMHVLRSYQLQDGNYVTGVAVSGNYGFIACGWDGFRVVDLTTMEAVASIDSLYYAFGLKMAGSHVYLNYGDPECPLAAIDISDPLSPQVLSIYHPPQDIANFAICDNNAYIADFDHGVRVVDIADPDDIHEVSRYSRYGHDLNVIVAGDLAYVQENYKLKIIDIADLQNPQELGYYELDWSYNDLKIVNDIGYIVQFSTTFLHAIDISDPTLPSLLGTFSVADNDVHYELAIYDHYAYITENNGLRIIDIFDPGNMQEVGYFDYGYMGNTQIEIIDHYAFLQGNGRLLKVFDLTDPLSPSILTTCDFGERYSGLKESDGLIYVTSSRTLRVFDMPTSGQWTPLSTSTIFFDDSRSIMGMDIQGNFLYLTDTYMGLNVYDITDYSSPRCVGYFATPGSAYGVAAIAEIAIVADRDNLGIYDCSGAITGIEQPDQSIPEVFSLLPNYPNPFNASTQIQFELPAPNHVMITVFDILGRDVATIADHDFTVGRHSLIFNGTGDDGKSIASGRYYIQAKSGNAIQNMPILLLK